MCVSNCQKLQAKQQLLLSKKKVELGNYHNSSSTFIVNTIPIVSTVSQIKSMVRVKLFQSMYMYYIDNTEKTVCLYIFRVRQALGCLYEQLTDEEFVFDSLNMISNFYLLSNHNYPN